VHQREDDQNSPKGLPSPLDGAICRSPLTFLPAVSGSGPPFPYLALGTAFDGCCEDSVGVVNPSDGSSRTARILAMLVFGVNLPINWMGHMLFWGKTKSCNSLFDFPSLREGHYHKRKGD
jgi:hypothetical protein